MLEPTVDYVHGMRFDAVSISPTVEQIDNGSRAYHEYSAKKIYALNREFQGGG